LLNIVLFPRILIKPNSKKNAEYTGEGSNLRSFLDEVKWYELL